MKFALAIITVLFASASADFLEQNTLCGDSQECTNRCRDSRYHVVVDNANSIYFGCSLKANNPVRYNNPDCRFGAKDGKTETTPSRATCDAVAGKLCPVNFHDGSTVNYCVILKADAAKFETACKANGGTAHQNSEGLTYNIAARNC